MGRAMLTNWRFYHFAWLAKHGPIAQGVTYKVDSQFTTFRVGSLIFYAYSTSASVPLLDINPVVFAVMHRLIPVWPSPPAGFGDISHILDRKECVRLIRHIVDIINPKYVIDPQNLLSDPDAPLSGNLRPRR